RAMGKSAGIRMFTSTIKAPPHRGNMNYLKEGTKDWVDVDLAIYYNVCSLGILPPPDAQMNGFCAVRAALWADNDIAESLKIILKRLYRNEVLLFDEAEEKFKWNEDFSLAEALRTDRAPDGND